MWDSSGLVLYVVDPAVYDLERGEPDAEGVCQHVRRGGGNAIRLVVHSDEGHVYYPSDLAPLPPGYELGRDYVGEFTEACRRHGLGLALSVNVAANAAVVEARPDWRQIAPDGTPHSWGDVPVMCVNTGYMQYMTDLLKELVARYGPDCLCLDNFVLLDGCRCEGCIGAFREDTGLELAAISPESEEGARYREWRFERTERLAWQAAMAAKRLRGDLRVVFSGCGWSPARDRALGWRPEHTIDWMDNVESGFALRWYGQELSDAGMIGAYHRALGRQGWCWVEYSPLPYTLLACPPAELRLKAGAVAAAGCRPCVRTLPPMPPADESGLDALGEFWSQFKGEDEALEIEGSLARTAVLHSRRAAEATGRDTDGPLRAWCSALTREHILWDFLLDSGLTREGLSPYRLLIIPETPYIAPRELEAIEELVRRGGSAIFVGEAARFGPEGEALPDFAAAGMMGVSLDEARIRPAGSTRAAAYLRVAETSPAALPRGLIPTGAHVPVRRVQAQVLAHAIPGPERPLAVPREDEAPAPGITWRVYVGGKVVCVASRLEPVLFGSEGPVFTSAERLVGGLVRWLGGERVQIRAPRNVTVQVYRSSAGATVHIVNQPEASARLHERVAPCRRIDIEVPQTLFVRDVRALDGREVDWNHRSDRLRLSTSGVREYRCIRIEAVLG